MSQEMVQWEAGAGLNEGSQKVQTSSYKINKSQGCNVQHDKYNQQCRTLYMKVKRVNPKSSHHKEKDFFLFL